MQKWLDRASIMLLIVCGLLYVGAKIHFSTRYSPVGLARYLEEHWFFWAAIEIVAGMLACLNWIKRRAERRTPN
jgi:hypothetical protein